MKSKFLLFLVAIFGITLLLPNNALSQKKYYIIFDNFEDQKTGDGTTITNLFDLCYWEHLRDDPILGKYAERKPFNAATLMNKDITDYDVAIFIMGTQNHLGSSVDGIKVLDKIKQMIAANKSVVIVGHAVIPAAFAQGGDAASKQWLEQTLGIKNVKVINHIINNTIYGFRTDGVEGDPVSAGYKKQCNRYFEENNSGLQAPIRWYSMSPVFEVSGGKNAKAFDYVKEIADQDITDVLVSGVRSEDNKARVIFYAHNFDICSGTHLIHYKNSLTRGIRWAIRDLPHPEGFLQLENEAIDFGVIEPNQSGYQTAVMQNNGREKIKISGFQIAGDEPEGSFEIIEGNGAVELGPGDIHILNLKFSPKEERLYEEYVTILSNGVNGNIEMSLKGQGGEQVFNGPKLSLTTLPVDFGSVPFGLYSEKNIGITNAGNVSLVVETFKLTEDAGKRFTFPEIVKTPITIPPGQTHYVKVRFTSSDEEAANFTGKIEVTSNGLNNMGNGHVDLKARAAGKNLESGIQLSATSVDFGTAEINKPKLYTLKISNVGGNNLRVWSIIFDKFSGGENLAQFKFADGSDKNIPILAPGESHDLKIEFTPEKSKEYAVRIQILTNDPINEGLIEVPVSGAGFDPSSVRDGVASIDGLSVTINPSPVNELSKIELNASINGNLDMNIMDISGRVVRNVNTSQINAGISTFDLNANTFANGTYFLVINFNGKSVQLPFVVTK
ncbi:hypothetical protein MASR1M45_14970 [Candidatus Kapaibacterium sp.]